MIRCRNCGAVNRIPHDKLTAGLPPVCGRCKTPVAVFNNKPIPITDATFSAEVEKLPVPVLVDMSVSWYPPCHMIAPILDELASELSGRVRIAKMNIDENPATAGRFKVQSIPSQLVIRDGKEVALIVGVQPKAEIARSPERVVA
jgi:thioredoxin 2